MTAIRGFVEAIEVDMIDVSTVDDLPDGRYIVGEVVVRLRTRAGTIPLPWKYAALPKIGDEVEIEVKE